jgi:hypothetical protein
MGKYRHFKNKEYETLCVAINTKTEEEMMVYRGLYGNHEVWTRPPSMFLGYKEKNEKQIKRFEKNKNLKFCFVNQNRIFISYATV